MIDSREGGVSLLRRDISPRAAFPRAPLPASPPPSPLPPTVPDVGAALLRGQLVAKRLCTPSALRRNRLVPSLDITPSGKVIYDVVPISSAMVLEIERFMKRDKSRRPVSLYTVSLCQAGLRAVSYPASYARLFFLARDAPGEFLEMAIPGCIRRGPGANLERCNWV